MAEYDFLIESAQKLLKERYEKEGHHSVVAASLITESGKIFTALNVGTYQPSISTCAEIIAIGMAHAAEKGMKIKAIAVVRDEEGYLITPCGKCREYIADYSDNALVMIPTKDGKSYCPTPIRELLPYKYTKKTF